MIHSLLQGEDEWIKAMERKEKNKYRNAGIERRESKIMYAK